jgi:predicted phage terminase large subunit-like protein
LLHVTNARLDLTGTENEIRALHAMFGPISAVLVEDAANGPSVIAHLREEISGLIAVTPEGGKMARMVAASPSFQAHNWIIERNGPWTHKVVEQLTMFPNCKNDDISDAISQAEIWLQANTYELGLLDWARKCAKEIAAGVRNEFGQLLRKPERKPEAAPAAEANAITRVDNFEIWLRTHRAPPCPACGNPSTVYRSRDELLCNQCGKSSINGAVISKPIQIVVGRNCCTHPLLQRVGGTERCGNCGKQSEPPAQPGMSRAQFRRHGGFMLTVDQPWRDKFGRFG